MPNFLIMKTYVLLKYNQFSKLLQIYYPLLFDAVAGYLIHCSTLTLAQVMCVAIIPECFVFLFVIRKSKD